MATQTNNGSWFDRITKKLGSLLSGEETKVEETKDESQETKVKSRKSKIENKETKVEKPKVPKKKVENRESKVENEKPIEDRQSLVKMIVSLLTELVDEPAMTTGKTLVLWVDADQLTFESYNSEAYRDQILDALINECGFGYEKIACKNGVPAAELKATPIGKSGKVFMQIVAKQDEAPKAVCCEAKISIFGNKGSLLQEQYILSSKEMKEKNIPAYNIGVSQYPKNCGYRENHIAIDDDPESPQAENNKYVSRKHAHIGFSDKFGFYLQVEMDGTKLMGKRTRIIRGQNFIECENPNAVEPLQTGDLIELGKAVVLRYEPIKEN